MNNRPRSLVALGAVLAVSSLWLSLPHITQGGKTKTVQKYQFGPDEDVREVMSKKGISRLRIVKRTRSVKGKIMASYVVINPEDSSYAGTYDPITPTGDARWQYGANRYMGYFEGGGNRIWALGFSTSLGNDNEYTIQSESDTPPFSGWTQTVGGASALSISESAPVVRRGAFFQLMDG